MRCRTYHLVAFVIAILVVAPSSFAGDSCSADFDGDGDVGFTDLVSLLAAWGPCPGCPQDLDGDDEVTFTDLLGLLSSWGPCVSDEPQPQLLAGRALTGYPWFEYVRSFNTGDPVQVAIDPGGLPGVGLTVDVYIVAAKTAAEWEADAGLVDVRGTPQTETFDGGEIGANIRTLSGGSSLDFEGGAALGIGYDVVFDANQNGELDGGDLIDGLGDEAGFYVVPDISEPGEFTTAATNYSGGTFLGQRTWYPNALDSLGQVPLIVISHGNGHQYTWYDYAQKHLASYGFIVMSHQNNTGPGIETASTTTLTNTDYIIENQATIGGGVLDGHIDTSRIIWIGHSRGGEGVVRAYDRLFDGAYTPDNFDLDDIISVVSISPTDFNGASGSSPHASNYHLIYGAADGDVQGNPGSGSKPFALYERGEGTKHVTYLQGTGHNEFNCCGFADASGPALIGRTAAQQVAKGYFLAIAHWYAEGSLSALDFLQRMYGSLRPLGIPGNVIVAKEYRESTAGSQFVVDDYQSETSTATSSSGGNVSFDVSSTVEGRMVDTDGSFVYSAAVPHNGMTRGKNGSDNPRCVVFEWTAPASYELEVIASERDLADDEFLSFRACQGTRHPNTDALDDGLSFTATLRDGSGATSSIDFSVYGEITRTYKRTGFGSGAGWGNEFNTVRIRLSDFANNGSGLDLTDVVAIRFEFGAGAGSSQGRIGLDDVMIIP